MLGDFLTTVGKLGFVALVVGAVGVTLLALTMPLCTATTGASFTTAGVVGFFAGTADFAVDAFFAGVATGLAATTDAGLFGIVFGADFALTSAAGSAGVSAIKGSCLPCDVVVFFSTFLGGVFVTALTSFFGVCFVATFAAGFAIGAAAGFVCALTIALAGAFFGAACFFSGAVISALGTRGRSLKTTVCTADWSSLGFKKVAKKLKFGRLKSVAENEAEKVGS